MGIEMAKSACSAAGRPTDLDSPDLGSTDLDSTDLDSTDLGSTDLGPPHPPPKWTSESMVAGWASSRRQMTIYLGGGCGGVEMSSPKSPKLNENGRTTYLWANCTVGP